MNTDTDYDKNNKSNGRGDGSSKESNIAADGTPKEINITDLRDNDEEESKSIESSTSQSVDKTSSSKNKPTLSTNSKLSKSKKVTISKKSRKHKPYGFPRRPLSAYNLFFKDTRVKIMEEEGKKQFQELVKMVAERWNCITFQEKEQYELRAADDMERYKRQVEEFEKNADKIKRPETQGGNADTVSGNSYDERSSRQNESRSSRPETSLFHHQQSRFSEVPGAMDVHLRGPGFSLQPSALDRLTDEELCATRHRLEMDLHAVEKAMARRLLQKTPGGAGTGTGVGFDTSTAQHSSRLAAPSEAFASQLGHRDASSSFDFRHIPMAAGNRTVGLAGPLSFSNPTDFELQIRMMQERRMGNMAGVGHGSLYGNMDRSMWDGFTGLPIMTYTDALKQKATQSLSHLTDEQLQDFVKAGKFQPR